WATIRSWAKSAFRDQGLNETFSSQQTSGHSCQLPGLQTTRFFILLSIRDLGVESFSPCSGEMWIGVLAEDQAGSGSDVLSIKGRSHRRRRNTPCGLSMLLSELLMRSPCIARCIHPWMATLCFAVGPDDRLILTLGTGDVSCQQCSGPVCASWVFMHCD